jgi:hypothetical protein
MYGSVPDAREGIKTRQVLLDATEPGLQLHEGTTNVSLAKIANDAIKQVEGSGNYTAVSARRLINGGILLELDSEEAARWINTAQNRLKFTAAFAPNARVKARLYPLVLQFIPLHFDPNQDAEIRNIENTNGLPRGSIDHARWLKPTHRRSPTQICGHALVTFTGPEVANKALTDGLIICQKRVYAEKCKKEPTRCLKCQGWNHMSYACPQTFDTCGTCGDRHKTSTCVTATKVRCTSCNTDSHASWDRNCPTFLAKCAEMDTRLTENAMPYFPTDEPWTHAAHPPRLPPQPLPNQIDRGGWTTATKRKGKYKQTTINFQPQYNNHQPTHASPATASNNQELGSIGRGATRKIAQGCPRQAEPNALHTRTETKETENMATKP